MKRNKQAYKLSHKRIWLTGAGTGIGAALATALAKKNNTLFISGRKAEPLEKIAALYPEQVITLPLDVRDSAALLAAAAEIKERVGGLDICIANAGISELFALHKTGNFDRDTFHRVFETNVFGVTNTITAALPLLTESAAPYLLAVSSIAGYSGLPTAEAYGASKAAVTYLMQSLYIDLAPHNIDVSVICPGFVKTPLTDKNTFPMPFLISPEKAADYIMAGMEKRPFEITFPKLFSYLTKFYGTLPPSIRRAIGVRMLPKS